MPVVADVQEQINKELDMIANIAYAKDNPYMASSLSQAEIFWLRRMYLYLDYLKERKLMTDEQLLKYTKSIVNFLWLRVNEERQGRNELVQFMGAIREEIHKAMGWGKQHLLGGSSER